MGEMGTLAKVVAVLGVMSLFAILLYPVGGPPAFTSLSSGFPTFNNPFSAKSFTYLPTADGNVSYFGGGLDKPLNIRGDRATEMGFCKAKEYPTSVDWWGCLKLADQNHTYVTTGLGGFSQDVQVQLEGFPDTSPTWLVLSVSVTFQCKSHGSGIQFSFNDGATNFWHVGDVIGATSCHVTGTLAGDDSNQAPGYVNATLTADASLDGVHPTNGIRGFGASTLIMENGGAIGDDDLLFISYVSVTVTYQRSANCDFQDAGNPWDNIVRATYYIGCVFAAFAYLIWDGINFVINGIIFVVQWLILIVTFLGDLVGTLLWFYNIPGMPPVLQGVIDVVVTVFAAILIYTVAKMLRGSGPV